MNNLQKAQQKLNATNIHTITPPLSQYSTKADTRKELAENIKYIRIKNQYNQRQIAKKANISQTTVSRAERGLWISLHNLLRLVDALEIKINLEQKQ